MKAIVGTTSTFIAALLMIRQYCLRVDDEGELKYQTESEETMNWKNQCRAGLAVGLILIAASRAFLFSKTLHMPIGFGALAWLVVAAIVIWCIDRSA